ncbi:translocation/assembly module TamB domain-containing protein [Waterburya agarophytonicola K14]|uniref:Translocation/assembly module TamB domain-containing protein n=1 Tax=Waterburya agarophytonicola KI4 TaxID=2874699 RepID=A0A964BU70_9CYAN|nr:translocation/assembly module TamB [Waterburya agarophytonicola]MCC0178583.1 translocation/assembly module TamB domain-containing protein [Waterburya agarophytonicola KI4]
MKQDPKHDREDSPNQDRATASTSWWRKIIITLAILLLGGAGSGLLYGWYFVRQKLVPLIETEAGNYLHRPLELGELKTIFPTGAKFGNSALPATNDNPDFVKVNTVKVNLAPLYFLRTRKLKIDIILEKPDVYIEQDESKKWTPTDFGSDGESEGGIKVEVTSIQLQGGQLALVAYNSETKALNPPVRAKIGEIIALPTDGQIKFDANAELIAGGKFALDGLGNTNTGIIEIKIDAENLDAGEISNLVALPIEFGRGNIDGKLDIVLTDISLPLLYGVLDLDGVGLQIPNLVKPFQNSDGKIHFQGTEIKLDDIATNFGEVSGKASGKLNLAEEGDYQIDTKIKPIEASKVINALELEAPVPIEGKITGDIQVRGNLENPVVKLDIASASPTTIDKVDFKQINADLEIIGTTLSVKQFTSLPKSGGTIAGNGKLQLDGLQNLVFNITANNVSGKAIARSYNNELPVDIGTISGSTNISAQAGDLSTLRFRKGKANFALGNGVVKVDNLDYGKGIWTSDLTTLGVEFGSLPFGEGSAPTIAKGVIDGKFDVSGTSDVGNLDLVDARGKADLNTVGGKIVLPKISLADGNWAANIDTKNLKLQRLFPELPNEFNDNLSGEFYLTGNIPDKAQPQTLINGFGDLTLAQGRVRVDDLTIVDQNWTAIAKGKDLKLKELSSTTPDQFAGLVNGTLNLAGTTDNITPEGIKARGNGSLTLPEGVFAAEDLAIANGQFNAQVAPQNVDLSLFADPDSDDLELKGKLGGKLAVTGQVDNLSPTAVSATGDVSFSQGIDLLEQPFEAKVAWDGRRLDVLKAQGDDLDAMGYIDLDPSFFSDIPDKLVAVEYFEFDVDRAKEIDITKLRLTLPTWATNLDYSGRGDFSGQISGIPSAMKIAGNISLKDFRVEEINFDPFLAGNVQISPETGVSLDLQEIITAPLFSTAADLDPEIKPLDKIELVLDKNFSPLGFAIVQDYISIVGTGKEEIIEMTTQNIPVQLIKTIALKSDDLEVPENIAIQPIDGELSGDFIFNLNTLATSGENVTIESPALASIRGDLLKGDFQYANGYFAIQDVEFQQRNSTYKLQGNIKQKPDDFIVDGRVSINGGQIQDILVALQIFELTDLSRIFSDRNYGDANNLYESSSSGKAPLFDIGLKDAPIFEQLELLSTIEAWLASIEQERQTAIIPPIKNLKGTFDGNIDVSGSFNDGLSSEFQFLGEKWRWGNLTSKKIVLQGNLREGILTLLPVSIQLENPILRENSAESENKINASSPTLLFTGTFGGETHSGQFRLVEVPVKLIEQLFSLPPELALDGLINASASIAGTQKEPQARGELRIDNASLNETSIQSTKGSFNYRNSRLDFSASSNIAEDADPLLLRGSIPYKLPFAAVEPQSDRLELQLNVKDKGLALLDIFSRGELKWIDGMGEIVLDISGVLDAKQNLPRKLVAQGTANIQNATVAIKNLPNNLLTNIDSEVFFDLSNIRVNSFTGDFGGGQVLAAGTIPLNKPGSPNPLTIDFNKIAVDVPKLYDGGLKGRIRILGKATEPIITGNITLFDGTILLVDESDPNSNPEKNITTGSKISAIKRRNTEESIAAITQYKNLQLKLGEDIQISQPPIFTFLATGDLGINGTFLQPSPSGTITLQRGQVNLFTTQLNLSRDYKNTARFSSNNILDPFLDVLLVGSAIETTGSRNIPSEASPTEKPDADSLGTLETVRIEAKVKGLASQITNKIELTSSPPRSQAEIVALLGGGFVETLANNTSTLGLASLAGSALFGSLNSEFNNAFPIGEVRLFPTQIIGDEDNPDDGNSDGIAGEIAFNLFNNFSFSVLRILNINDIPTQYGFRYRLNKYFVLRGSSDFKSIRSDRELKESNEDQGNTRVLIEFESRF